MIKNNQKNNKIYKIYNNKIIYKINKKIKVKRGFYQILNKIIIIIGSH